MDELDALRMAAGIAPAGKQGQSGMYNIGGDWQEFLPERMPNPKALAADKERQRQQALSEQSEQVDEAGFQKDKYNDIRQWEEAANNAGYEVQQNNSNEFFAYDGHDKVGVFQMQGRRGWMIPNNHVNEAPQDGQFDPELLADIDHFYNAIAGDLPPEPHNLYDVADFMVSSGEIDFEGYGIEIGDGVVDATRAALSKYGLEEQAGNDVQDLKQLSGIEEEVIEEEIEEEIEEASDDVQESEYKYLGSKVQSKTNEDMDDVKQWGADQIQRGRAKLGSMTGKGGDAQIGADLYLGLSGTHEKLLKAFHKEAKMTPKSWARTARNIEYFMQQAAHSKPAGKLKGDPTHSEMEISNIPVYNGRSLNQMRDENREAFMSHNFSDKDLRNMFKAFARLIDKNKHGKDLKIGGPGSTMKKRDAADKYAPDRDMRTKKYTG